MALTKAIDTPIGAQATYWRIVQIQFDLVSRTVWYLMAGYLTQAVREAGKAPIMSTALQIPMADADTPESLTRGVLYTRAKAASLISGVPSMFDGATDA